jgi:hypothetical protein
MAKTHATCFAMVLNSSNIFSLVGTKYCRPQVIYQIHDFILKENGSTARTDFTSAGFTVESRATMYARNLQEPSHCQINSGANSYHMCSMSSACISFTCGNG